MTASKRLHLSVPFVSHAAAQESFALRFVEAHLLLTPGEVEQIRVLCPEAWPEVWIPAHSRRACERFEKQSADASSDKAKRKAHATFYRALERATQEASLPHTFLLMLQQLNLDAFPLWHMQNRNWLGVPAGLQHTDIAWQDFTRFWHQHVFASVRDWLKKLPVPPDEPVYVAENVEHTLAMPWRLFVEHWDAFSGWKGRLNVANDDPRWYLMFHREDVFVYGCTPEYAQENTVPDGVCNHPDEVVGRTFQYISEWERQHALDAGLKLYTPEQQPSMHR